MKGITSKGVDKSLFVETFGESPLIKVLDFFLTFDSFDYSKSQISKETGVSRVTLNKIWNKLVEKEILVKTREIGKAEMFKLNVKNPKVKALMDFDMKLASCYANSINQSIQNVKISIHQKINQPISV